MFFTLSKIFYYFIVPTNWLLVLAILYFVFKSPKAKKRLAIAMAVIFILFSNNALYRISTLAWQPKAAHPAYHQSFSAGIVLCGMTMSDRYNEVFFGGTADRFLQTARLYHTGIIKHILISGGDGRLGHIRAKEPYFLKDEFKAMGIPDSVLFVEFGSRNTYESGEAARPILDSLRFPPPYLLITSALHMPRSIKTFEHAGLSVAPYPADFKVIDNKIGILDCIVPDLVVLTQWQYLIKEMVGLAVYKMTGKA